MPGKLTPSQWFLRVLAKSRVVSVKCWIELFETYSVRILSPVLLLLCRVWAQKFPQYNLFPCRAKPSGYVDAGSWTTVLISPPAKLLDCIFLVNWSTEYSRVRCSQLGSIISNIGVSNIGKYFGIRYTIFSTNFPDTRDQIFFKKMPI